MAFIDSKYYNAIKKELYFMFHKFQEKILNQEDGN